MKIRFRLWQIMTAVALVAVIFAVFGDLVDVIAAMAVILAIFLPIVLASRSRKLSVAAWVFSLYPFLLLASLYATWFTAWIVLGHSPRSSLDDPKYISPLVDVPYTATAMLMIGCMVALPVSVCLTLTDMVWKGIHDDNRPSRLVAEMIVRVFLWISNFALFRWQPLNLGYVIEWYFDKPS